MNKISAPVFAFAFLGALFAFTPTYAQTANSPVYYSPDQYPTAQGKYLQLPGNYQQNAAPSPQPTPVLSSPRYVAPAVVAPASSRIDIPPMRPVVTYPQTRVATSAAPQAAAPTPVLTTPQYVVSTGAALPAYASSGAVYSNTSVRTAPMQSPKIREQGISLGTITGVEVGFQVSHYHYKETDAGAELDDTSGMTYGLTVDGTKSFDDGWFAEGDLRGTYGSHHYTGADFSFISDTTIPSSASSIPDWMFDIRVLGGRDYLFPDAFWGFGDLGVSPYAGLGYRFLYENSKGITDTNGVPFYRRYSHYVYLPVGSTARMRVTENSRLSLNTEADLLIGGWQTSALGDAVAGAPDFTNSQNEGYGLRGSLMYEYMSWSAGPFLEYWNITHSDATCENVPGLGPECVFEPHNTTLELGVQARYRF